MTPPRPSPRTPRRSRGRRLWHAQESGQSLVLVALTLPLLLALMLTMLELHERMAQRALLDDAIRTSARSAIQSFDYAAFAQGAIRVDSNRARADATRFLSVNATNVRGMPETPAALAARLAPLWAIYPNGGTCTFPQSGDPPITFATPAMCLDVVVPMEGLFGWSLFQTHITVAETLDPLDPNP